MTHRDLTFKKGTTFRMSVLWESSQLRYRPITDVALTAPVRVTAPAHGVPDGWPIAIVNVVGTSQINATNSPPRDADFRPATAVSADVLEINGVNGAAFKAYKSGGQVVYYEPTSLLDVKVRMPIRRTPGGPIVFEPSTEAGTITLDLTRSRIEIEVATELVADLDWRSGTYDLIAEDATGVDILLLQGCATVTP